MHPASYLHWINSAVPCENSGHVIEGCKPHLVARFDRRACHVRREKYVLQIRKSFVNIRLVSIYIQASGEEVLRFQRIEKRVLVHQRSPRCIDEHRSGRQESKFLSRHNRCTAARNMERQNLTLRQHLAKARAVNCPVLQSLRSTLNIGIDDAHTESLCALGNSSADSPKPHNTKGLTVDPRTQHFRHSERLSPPASHDALVFRRAPTRCQYKKHREVRRAFSQCIRRIRDDDAAFTCSSYIHMIEASAGVSDDFDGIRQARNVLRLQA